MFLKKTKVKNIFFLSICFLIFYSFSQEVKSVEKNSIKKLNNYFNNINNFSSDFIQSGNQSIEEGSIHINKNLKRIKIEYKLPTKIIIILTKSKAMYFNVDLEEVNYFNPKKSIANTFFDIFYNNNFLKQAISLEGENFIEVSKEIDVNDKKTILKIIFEKNPLIIKQLKIINDESKIVMTLVNSDFNASFTKNFFSMSHPLLK